MIAILIGSSPHAGNTSIMCSHRDGLPLEITERLSPSLPQHRRLAGVAPHLRSKVVKMRQRRRHRKRCAKRHRGGHEQVWPPRHAQAVRNERRLLVFEPWIVGLLTDGSRASRPTPTRAPTASPTHLHPGSYPGALPCLLLAYTQVPTPCAARLQALLEAILGPYQALFSARQAGQSACAAAPEDQQGQCARWSRRPRRGLLDHSPAAPPGRRRASPRG
jgi:hypothetical protein